MEQQSQTMPTSTSTKTPAATLPGIGDLFRQTKELIMKRKNFFFMIASVPAVLQLISGIFYEINLAFAMFGILFAIAAGIISVLTGIAIIKGLADEKMSNWKAAYSQSKELFWPALWVGILVGIVTFIGFLLFIIPGIYLSIVFAFYLYVLVLEGKTGWSAADRSKELVKGYWGAIFLRWLALIAVVLFVSIVFVVIVGYLGSGILNTIATALISIVLTPFVIGYMYLLYQALLKVKGGKTKQTEAEPKLEAGPSA